MVCDMLAIGRLDAVKTDRRASGAILDASMARWVGRSGCLRSRKRGKRLESKLLNAVAELLPATC